MEGLEINSTSAISGSNKNKKFKDLSSFIYNRHTLDKTMCVEVSEINFIVSLETLLCELKDKNKLCKLICSNIDSLFKIEFINKIKSLSKKDFINICDYHKDKDSFSGIEYHILKHIIDSDIKIFEDDIKSSKLSKIIQLSVSENNLIVKVFPSKSTEDYPVSYTISLLYLVLLQLYKRINKNTYKYFSHTEKYICWVIKSMFATVTPITTKVVYTVTTTADDNYSWFTQLKQLKSAYGFLCINNDENQVKWTFRPKEHYLTSTLNTPVINNTPSDTNYTRRFIECNYILNKDNSLTCRTTIVSKEMIDCVFATATDEIDEPASMYSNLSDDEYIYLANYSTLHRILSFTQQHEKLKLNLNKKVSSLGDLDKYAVFTDIPSDEKFKCIRNNKTKKQAFKDIKIPLPDDKLLLIIKKELLQLRQKNNLVDYIITILELFDKDKDVIEDMLAPLDERTAEKIKKVIRKLKKIRLTYGFSLNKFYKEN